MNESIAPESNQTLAQELNTRNVPSMTELKEWAFGGEWRLFNSLWLFFDFYPYINIITI